MRAVVLTVLLSGAALYAQDAADRVTIPFPAAGQPRKLQVNVLNGSITVRGTQGNDAIIEGRGGRERSNDVRADGLRRLEPQGSGIKVDQNENTIRITSSPMAHSDITVQVPRDTSLVLKSVNGGHITVENVSGEIEANNTNGRVTLTNVSGSVVAHSLNGRLVVTMDQVTAGKAMSFSTLNGDIDVTLPPDTKANLRMKTDNGDIFTDFDVKTEAAEPPQSTPDSGSGRRRIQFDRGVSGSINGGGPELRFTTLNGKIFIRKKK